MSSPRRDPFARGAALRAEIERASRWGTGPHHHAVSAWAARHEHSDFKRSSNARAAGVSSAGGLRVPYLSCPLRSVRSDAAGRCCGRRSPWSAGSSAPTSWSSDVPSATTRPGRPSHLRRAGYPGRPRRVGLPREVAELVRRPAPRPSFLTARVGVPKSSGSRESDGRLDPVDGLRIVSVQRRTGSWGPEGGHCDVLAEH